MAKHIITFAIIGIVAIAGRSFAAAAPTGGTSPKRTTDSRRCFPKAIWGATAGLRPCVQITRVYEDGSFKYAVSDANGTTRYSGGVGAADR